MSTSRSGYYSTIAALFLVIAIDSIGVGLVWPLFAPLFTGKTTVLFASSVSMQTKNLLFGITIGTFPICMLFSSPIVGDISDRIGRKKVLLICLLGTSLAFGICALGIVFKKIVLLILGRALLGTLAGSQATAQAVVVDICEKSKKATSLSIISLAGNLGTIFGPILGSILTDNNLVSWFSIYTPFYSAAIIALFNAMLLAVTFKHHSQPKKIEKINFTKGVELFIAAFINKELRQLTVIVFLFYCGWAIFFQSTLLNLIQTHNYTTVMLGKYLTWLGVIFCFVNLAVIRLVVTFFQLNKITFAALILTTLGTLAVVIFGQKNIGLLIIPIVTGVALTNNTLMTRFSDAVPPDSQGWAMGVMGALTAASWALSSLIVGTFSSISFHLDFILAAMMFCMAVLVQGCMLNRKINY